VSAPVPSGELGSTHEIVDRRVSGTPQIREEQLAEYPEELHERLGRVPAVFDEGAS
jgi:hypothetical protein